MFKKGDRVIVTIKLVDYSLDGHTDRERTWKSTIHWIDYTAVIPSGTVSYPLYHCYNLDGELIGRFREDQLSIDKQY